LVAGLFFRAFDNGICVWICSAKLDGGDRCRWFALRVVTWARQHWRAACAKRNNKLRGMKKKKKKKKKKFFSCASSNGSSATDSRLVIFARSAAPSRHHLCHFSVLSLRLHIARWRIFRIFTLVLSLRWRHQRKLSATLKPSRASALAQPAPRVRLEVKARRRSVSSSAKRAALIAAPRVLHSAHSHMLRRAGAFRHGRNGYRFNREYRCRHQHNRARHISLRTRLRLRHAGASPHSRAA